MKVYFACSSTKLGNYIDHYVRIVNYIKGMGFVITDNWLFDVKKKTKKSDYNLEETVLPKDQVREEGIKAIKQSDVLIADLSIPSASVGYQVSLAIEEGLSVLCIYSLDFGIKKAPQVILSVNSSSLKIASYRGDSYKKVVKNFLKDKRKKELVRFNFVATREIIQYLDWLSSELSLSKSAALRKEIEDKLIKNRRKYYKISKNGS